MTNFRGVSNPAAQRSGSTKVCNTGHLNPAGNAIAKGPEAMETADGRTIGRARTAGSGLVKMTGATRGGGNPVR